MHCFKWGKCHVTDFPGVFKIPVDQHFLSCLFGSLRLFQSSFGILNRCRRKQVVFWKNKVLLTFVLSMYILYLLGIVVRDLALEQQVKRVRVLEPAPGLWLMQPVYELPVSEIFISKCWQCLVSGSKDRTMAIIDLLQIGLSQVRNSWSFQ